MSSLSRHDAFLFYSVTSISFLESAVPHYVRNLDPFFAVDPAVAGWLRDTWLPEESAHGHATRAYVLATWPEFDWNLAYGRFLERYVPRCDHGLLRPSVSLEALARCVTETQAAMTYRALAGYARDPALGRLFVRLARDETRHYAYFRDVLDRYAVAERTSRWRLAATLVARSRLVRDEDLALAFAPLNAAWSSPTPFAPMTYDDFLSRGAEVMAKHLPVEAATRMLVRPLTRGRAWERPASRVLAWMVGRQFGIPTGRAGRRPHAGARRADADTG
jgi:hypothetical protein